MLLLHLAYSEEDLKFKAQSSKLKAQSSKLKAQSSKRASISSIDFTCSHITKPVNDEESGTAM